MLDEDNNSQNNGGSPPPKPSIFSLINNYVLLFYAVTCFIIYYTLSGLLYLNGQVILSIILPGLVAFVLPLYLLTSRVTTGFSSEFGLKAPEAAQTGLVILIAAGSVLPVDAVAGFFEQFRPVDADYINLLIAIKPKGILSFCALAFGLVITGPFAEELIFRGFIQRIFQRNMGPAPAVALSGLIFGISHFDLTLIPGTTALGVIFGYIYLRSGNLFYPFFAHALFNLVSLLRLHFTSVDALKSGGVYQPPVLWVLLSAALLGYSIWIFERRRLGGKDG
jgi:membrane protease YdiL (CAAX protease family)